MISKKLSLLLLAISLTGVPVESLAAYKKSHKRASVSQKKHYIKASSRSSRAYRMNVRLRQARALQAQRQQAFELGENYDGSGILQLASSKALIINQNTGEVVYAKNTNTASPIASITKLMTAMVMLDAKQPLDETIYVSDADVDYVKGTRSRLSVGAGLTRGDMLQLALMSSENRAASALASNYPGGQFAFIKAMNVKARALGLSNTHFVDPTGLESENVSTAEDLAKMVQAAYQYPEIRMASTSPSHEIYIGDHHLPSNFVNTNGLVRSGEWEIGLSKTGFINEAGRCLVMQAKIVGEPMIIVLLDSSGKLTRIGDANRVRKWMEYNSTTTTGANTGAPNEVMAGKIS
jgi:D-alanyl-D-alanine endopeptidase (penicillin-binding protein 7)